MFLGQQISKGVPWHNVDIVHSCSFEQCYANDM